MNQRASMIITSSRDTPRLRTRIVTLHPLRGGPEPELAGRSLTPIEHKVLPQLQSNAAVPANSR
jgi:hypothetical protein